MILFEYKDPKVYRDDNFNQFLLTNFKRFVIMEYQTNINDEFENYLQELCEVESVYDTLLYVLDNVAFIHNKGKCMFVFVTNSIEDTLYEDLIKLLEYGVSQYKGLSLFQKATLHTLEKLKSYKLLFYMR